MADIFLSYKSEDRDRVRPIVECLEQTGWEVFWDVEISAGENWDKKIETELYQASVILVVWSKASVSSDWVKDEADYGKEKLNLIPVQIDHVKPPLGFRRFQVADLTGWREKTNDHKWIQVTKRIKHLLSEIHKSGEIKEAVIVPTDNSNQRADEKAKTPVSGIQNLISGKSTSKLKYFLGFSIVLIALGFSWFYVPKPKPDPPFNATSNSDEGSDSNSKPLESSASDPLSPTAPGSTFPLPSLKNISGACFTMGSPGKESNRFNDEGPQHEVCLKDFKLSQHEVTFQQYDAFVHDTDGDLPKDGEWGRDQQPVIEVSWDDAIAYTTWLSAEIKLTCNLPSEAQWEFAARAGTTTRYALPAPGGSNTMKNAGLANCDDCGSRWDDTQTAPVGSFAANKWGLFDMHGNVWEWTEDCMHENYTNAPNDGTAWLEADAGRCKSRVLRGGSWNFNSDSARSANRIGGRHDARNRRIGFRVMCIDRNIQS